MSNSSFAFGEAAPPAVFIAARMIASDLAKSPRLSRADLVEILTEQFGARASDGCWSARETYLAVAIAQVLLLQGADERTLASKAADAGRLFEVLKTQIPLLGNQSGLPNKSMASLGTISRYPARNEQVPFGATQGCNPAGSMIPAPTRIAGGTDRENVEGSRNTAPTRLMRLPAVIERVGLSRSAIYKRMSEGRFPKCRSLGPKFSVWIEAEIEAWIESIVRLPSQSDG